MVQEKLEDSGHKCSGKRTIFPGHWGAIATRARPGDDAKPPSRKGHFRLAANVGSADCLQAVGTECGLIGGDCEPDPALLAPNVSRKCPLFAGLSAAVCKPLQLGDLQPDHWLAEYTTELINVLHVLGRLVELEPVQAELLEQVCSGQTFTAAELRAAGALPVTPRSTPRARGDEATSLALPLGEGEA
jgi:hypothetical protein